MNLAETIYQHSLRLPEPAAREVLDFIEFLEQRNDIAVSGTVAPRPTAKPRRAGSAKGKLIVLAEDDEHLRDFGEYMP